LIAGEQLGIGGSYDVRGYQERETSGDKGEIVKVELTTPTYEQFSLFTFYDYGHGHNNSAIEGQLKDWSLNSTGVGANWQWRQNVSAKLTYAVALNDVSNFPDAQTSKSGDSRILATVVVRY
jgi:hemolysin activation/secretion protein